MTRRISVAPEAEEEITEAALWYESKRSGLGIEFVAAIDRALERIAVAPSSYAKWRTEFPYRRAVLTRFPFQVFYTEIPTHIHVWAIAHSKRRPGYWLHR